MPEIVHYVRCKWCGKTFDAGRTTEEYDNAYEACSIHEKHCTANPNNPQEGWTYKGPPPIVRWPDGNSC